MNRTACLGSRNIAFVLALCVIGVLGSDIGCLAREGGSQCMELRGQWERLINDLRESIRNYQAIQKAPLEQITQRPLVDYGEGKTIARQISEAIQQKEKLLSAKRKECRSILNLENQAFTAFEKCSKGESSGKKSERAFKRLSRKRQKLVNQAVISITEVRAVEGENTVMPYSQAYRDPYRSGNNYWQDYQQMYRGYWGR